MSVSNVGLDKLKLLDIPLFSGLDRIHLAKLIPVLEEIQYKAGEVIFQQGEFGDSMYIIARGTASVFIGEGDDVKELVQLREKECFGEMSLLTGDPRSAGVRSITELIVLRLVKERFEELLLEHNSLAVQFAGILARRLAAINKQGSKEPAVSKLAPNEATVDVLLPVDSGSDAVVPDDGRTVLQEKSKTKVKNKIPQIILGGMVWVFLYVLLSSIGLNATQLWDVHIFLAAAFLWSLNLVPAWAVALAMSVLAVAVQAAGAEQVLSGFAEPALFMALGLVVVAGATARSGLLYRLTLIIVSRLPASFPGQVVGWSLAGLFLTPLAPSPKVRLNLASRLVAVHCDTLGLKNSSVGSAGLAMAVWLGFGQLSFLFMNGATACFLVYGLLPPQVKVNLSYGLWLKAALPLGSVFLLLSLVSTLFCFRHQGEIKFDRTVIEDQLIVLGSLTTGEKLSLGTSVLYLAGLFFFPVYQWGAWFGLLSFLLLWSSPVQKDQVERSDDWLHIISLGALLGFGAALASSGLPEVLIGAIAPFQVFITNRLLFFWVVVIFMLLIRFVLPLPPALLAGMMVFIPLSSLAGVNPFLIGLVLLMSGNAWFYPRQSSHYPNLLENTGGKLFHHKQTRPVSLYYSLICLLAVALALPCWQLMGLVNEPGANISGVISPVYGQGGDNVTVAVTGSWSGREGLSLTQGIGMAVDEINSEGGLPGRTLKVVFSDTEEDPNRQMDKVLSLSGRKAPTAVIACWPTVMPAQAIVASEKAGLVALSVNGLEPSSTSQEYQYTFSCLPDETQFGQLAAEYIANRGLRRPVLYYLDKGSGRLCANAFEDRATELGLVVVDRLSEDGGIKSSVNHLEKWQYLGFDSLFVVGALPVDGEFISRLRQAGSGIPILVSRQFDSPDLNVGGDRYLEGTTVLSVFNSLDQRPDVQHFVSAFKNRYGYSPSPLAARGYDAVKLLAWSVRQEGTVSSKKIAARLQQLKNWPGVIGTYNFNQHGRLLGKEDIITKQIKDGAVSP